MFFFFFFQFPKSSILPEIKLKVVEYVQVSLSGREGKHDSKFEKGFRQIGILFVPHPSNLI